MASSVKPFDATEPVFGGIDASTAASLLAVGGDIALVVDALHPDQGNRRNGRHQGHHRRV